MTRSPRPVTLLLALTTLLGACGPKPIGEVSAATGLVGTPVAKGSLAGTWAQAVLFATIVPIPVLGDRNGGGRSTRLVTRVWNAKEDRYDETFLRCTNQVFDVEGAKTVVLDETLAKIAPVLHTSHAAHSAGTYQSDTIVDLWGVRNLPDPIETPLPTPANYTVPPQSDQIWDEDEDGKPGVTIYMRGAISGKLYVVKRTVYSFDGTIVAPDRIAGLVTSTRAESNSVDSTVAWMKGTGASRPNPDPLESWFEMVRLEPGATCESVAAAVESGKLSTSRPF